MDKLKFLFSFEITAKENLPLSVSSVLKLTTELIEYRLVDSILCTVHDVTLSV